MSLGLRAVGVHCYLGGFQCGLMDKGVEIVGALETWEPGIVARGRSGVPLPDRYDDHVDLVFGNPPCSRFSLMSYDKYTDEERNDLTQFCELGELLDESRRLHADVTWWETGPMLFNNGIDMVQQAQDYLGAVATVVALVDLRSFGVPQRRPRCHVIHVKHPINVDAVVDRLTSAWPIPETLGRWLESKECFPRGPKAERWIVEAKIESSTFISRAPWIVSVDNPYSRSIVSGRKFYWHEHGRWWDPTEYAQMMCMPPNVVRDAHLMGDRFLSFLAKQVSPSAAAGVHDQVLTPMLAVRGDDRGVHRVKLHERDVGFKFDGMYRKRRYR